MVHWITVLPGKQNISAPDGAMLLDVLRQHGLAPEAPCGGNGRCGKCAYPEPCRFPEKACSSMEGYGLFVTQVCRDNGAQYYHGEGTVTYTACILF